jgi:molybdate transport system ATP-binding protein
VIDIDIDIDVTQGEFELSLLDSASVEVLGVYGHSGSGKTTLLETIAGLRRPSRGAIRIGGRTLYGSDEGIDLPPQARRVGYVPQDSLLFPHLTVKGNIDYGNRRSPNREPDAASPRPGAPSLIEMLELGPLLDRRVQGLSGGERQRVAMARALNTQPALLLLDEPLAAVDRGHRDRIVPYLLRIRRELHVPLVYVTHDAAELVDIADRVLVIERGRLLRAGPPSSALTA